jgi:Cu/Ag efflux pump CusA
MTPVVLTATATILGMIPLAIGLNINFYGLFTQFKPDIWLGGENVVFWGPLAWTIVFGLSYATFITLLVVPVMYLLNERFRSWVFRVLNIQKKPKHHEPVDLAGNDQNGVPSVSSFKTELPQG